MNIRGSNIWSKLLFPEIITFIPGTANKIFLTFDDGPTPGITNQVLAFLSQYRARATFFCKGSNAEAKKDLFEQISSLGHRIGNHGYDHLDGWKTSASRYRDNCLKAAEIIPGRIFRPPYGRITPAQYKALKNDFTIYLWTAMSWDFHPWVSQERCLKHSTRNFYPGSILVFHDTEQAASKLLHVLPRLLQLGKEKGYEFAPLP